MHPPFSKYYSLKGYYSQRQFSALAELQPGKVVRPSVCLSVTKSYDTSRHLIFPKLGQMLEGDERGTLTRPDFPRKIYLINYS